MVRLCAHDIDTPLGPMVAIVSERDEGLSLATLEFSDRRALPGERRHLDKRSPCEIEDRPLALHDQIAFQLHAYFAGDRTGFDIPLDTPGTPFQRAVWDQLQRIPHGQTRSYAQIAQAVGSPGAQRAVGTANGANRIAIVIPCHRVIEASGNLRGYAGGVERKRALLALEGAWPVEPTLFPQAPAEASK